MPKGCMDRRGVGFASLSAGALLALGGAAYGQSSPSLASYFGFEAPRIVVVDEGAGPAIITDIDGDGRMDLVCANNRKSRIEIHRQRSEERSPEEMEREFKVNELKPSRWFDRVDISVSHQISGMRIADVNGDGRKDIVYAGRPAELVLLSQESKMSFEVESRRRVRGLGAGQDGIEIADVTGDGSPELLALVDGAVNVWALGAEGAVGEPEAYGSGLVAFFIEDYDGDGRMDLLGINPENDAPLRMWLQEGVSGNGSDGALGAELRFEMPALVEVEPVRTPGRDAASIAVIERQSRRMVLYDLAREAVEQDGASERDALPRMYALRGGEDRDRSVVVADIDGDGLEDLLATDREGNGVVLHTQRLGVGMGSGELFSAFKSPKTVAAGQWDGSGPLEVFILSEEEKTVGVSSYDASTDRLSFPQPIALATEGAAPVAMGAVDFGGTAGVAVIVKDRRDHTLEVHRATGDAVVVKLEGVTRPPQSMLSGDFDADGKLDIAMFTPGEPMVLVLGVDGDTTVLTDETMPQFGLVQAAGPVNTAMLDIDGDGTKEMLIADENFVRACSFDAEAGWRVVDQITAKDSSTKFTALAVLEGRDGPTVVASDSANDSLAMIAQDGGNWGVTQRLRLNGGQPRWLRAGAFGGDGSPTIMMGTDDAFGLVALAGERLALEEFAVYRSDNEDRFEHEIEVGDINGDGYTDLIVLDAREQMCQIFTLSAARKLYYATEFKVFESRLFAGGGGRGYEPSAVIVEDVTGDGATDLTLQVHDRYLIFPQMIR